MFIGSFCYKVPNKYSIFFLSFFARRRNVRRWRGKFKYVRLFWNIEKSATFYKGIFFAGQPGVHFLKVKPHKRVLNINSGILNTTFGHFKRFFLWCASASFCGVLNVSFWHFKCQLRQSNFMKLEIVSAGVWLSDRHWRLNANVQYPTS